MGTVGLVSLSAPRLRLLLLLFGLLFRFVPVRGDNCKMEIWVFDSLERCNTTQPPNANGYIYADDQCRTVEAASSTASSDYLLFPGTYRAYCTSAGKIHFSDSGCTSPTCSIAASSRYPNACDRDFSTAASLYSRLDSPEYVVQQPSDATLGTFYTCFRLLGQSQTVSFVIFGNCSDPSCSIDGNPPQSGGGPVANPTPAPVVAPVVAPTTEPPTPAPVNASTKRPTTKAPTLVPTSGPSTLLPTSAPIQAGEPTKLPTTDLPTVSPTPQVLIGNASVALQLSGADLDAPFPPSGLTFWETVTAEFVTNSSAAEGVIVTAVYITNINQAMVENRTLQISFDLGMSFYDGALRQTPLVKDLFWNAFDTPEKQSAYLDLLNVPSYTVAVVDLHLPTIPPVSSPPTSTPLSVPTAPSAPTSTLAPAADSGILTGQVSASMIISPISATVPDSPSDDNNSLVQWAAITKEQIHQSADKNGVSIILIDISDLSQTLVTGNGRRLQNGRRLEDQSLDISFNLSMSYKANMNPAPTVATLFQNNFDTEKERASYVLKLVPIPGFESARVVRVLMTGDAVSPSVNASRSPDGTIGIIAGVATGSVLIACVIGFFIYMQKKKVTGSKGDPVTGYGEESPSSNGGGGQHGTHATTADPSRQRWTNEILVDPSADDVSTLGGSVLAGLNMVEGNAAPEDDPTVSVNLDYDYGRSRYNTDESRSRSMGDTVSAEPTTFTSYSKFGMLGDSVFADDQSFEQQYADEYFDSDKTDGRVKPFEVRAPPGMLGMVVDTPDGSVPVVRNLKPDSVLKGRVLIGDRLISVDNQNVTKMTALEVSSLISMKQNQQRLLVFLRIEDRSAR
jgi:hypothetical protein